MLCTFACIALACILPRRCHSQLKVFKYINPGAMLVLLPLPHPTPAATLQHARVWPMLASTKPALQACAHMLHSDCAQYCVSKTTVSGSPVLADSMLASASVRRACCASPHSCEYRDNALHH